MTTYNSHSIYGKRIGHLCTQPQKRYQDIHKTGLKGIQISLEMNLGQNNYIYMEKRVNKKLLS